MEEKASLNGIEIAYEITGNGPRVVWCHGLASCMEGDRDVIDAIARHFTVLAYDARGHGHSSPVRDVSWFSYAHLAGDLVALLDHVGWARTVLAGASMGAATAARVACLHPERIEALVFVRPAAAGPDGAAPLWLQLLFKGGAHAIRSGGIEAAIEFLMTIPQARAEIAIDPERIDVLRRDWARHDPISIAAALEGVPPTPPLAGGLAAEMISCPVLIVPGDDLIHPTEAAHLIASLIPHAVLTEPFDGIARAEEVERLALMVREFVGVGP